MVVDEIKSQKLIKQRMQTQALQKRLNSGTSLGLARAVYMYRIQPYIW